MRRILFLLQFAWLLWAIMPPFGTEVVACSSCTSFRRAGGDREEEESGEGADQGEEDSDFGESVQDASGSGTDEITSSGYLSEDEKSNSTVSTDLPDSEWGSGEALVLVGASASTAVPPRKECTCGAEWRWMMEGDDDDTPEEEEQQQDGSYEVSNADLIAMILIVYMICQIILTRGGLFLL